MKHKHIYSQRVLDENIVTPLKHKELHVASFKVPTKNDREQRLLTCSGEAFRHSARVIC
jgi:hypothetical protein